MNASSSPRIARSTCPHDCPSACALEVELPDERTIGRIRGSRSNSYTAGVICEKVARYAERLHHPDRLTGALRRKGAKGDNAWQRLPFDDALDEVADAFLKAERRFGPQAVWPYFYAGTMGLVMRHGISRLTHVKGYARMHASICSVVSNTGFAAGTGRLAGADPREMAKSDLIVIWGTNPVHTQVNVMSHVTRARRERGAKIAVVDIYENATVKQADLGLVLRPGTDGALACAVMHVLFRDELADWPYLRRHTDCPEALRDHLRSRTPEWAAAITGLTVEEIEKFAALIGSTDRSFFRLGYGFTRQRNGAVNMHAAASIAAVRGSWRHEGGGAFYSNGDIYGWDMSMITGSDAAGPPARVLDQSRIGPVLTGDPSDIGEGPPVAAMLIQSTNPASVAPEQKKVIEGLRREDLFVCVHEQFMTETAALADIVLPATMFLEHDDLYQGGGHQHIMLGPELVRPPGDCRSNHAVVCGLARRLGAEHPGFAMTARELIDWTLTRSGHPPLAALERDCWLDVQPDFRAAHYLDGFAHPDGKYRFRPDWRGCRAHGVGGIGPVEEMPALPDHWPVNEAADARHPFELATSPARRFLNSTFTETPTSRRKEGCPRVMMHPLDLAGIGARDGARLRIGNRRGEVVLSACAFEGVQRGVIIVESIWPNAAFEAGEGINVLIGADRTAPCGGAAFHDCHVWARPEGAGASSGGS